MTFFYKKVEKEKTRHRITKKRVSTSVLTLFSSEPDRIRTYDRLLRREVLYPAELRALFNKATQK
jgi:hypothetical protein